MLLTEAPRELENIWSEDLDEVTSLGVLYFTEGDCWYLAWHLHKITNWNIVLAESSDGNTDWYHVAVKTDRGTILDIHGEQSLEIFQEVWESNGWDTSNKGNIRKYAKANYRSYRMYLNWLFGNCPEISTVSEEVTKLVAHKLLEKAGYNYGLPF